MPEPQRMNTDAAMAALQVRLDARGLGHVTAGPVPDDPDPELPGHPEYHRRVRAEFALTRWQRAVPTRYSDATTNHPRIAAWALQVARQPKEARSLLLTGTTGTGKTHAAWGALRAVADAGPARYEILATTAADMYGRLRPGGSPNGAEYELKQLVRIPLLLLDDLGSAKASEWVEETTYRIVNERYNACFPTVFTSNYPGNAPRDDETGQILGPGLDLILGDRIISRLIEMTDVISMTGPTAAEATDGRPTAR